MPFADVEDFNCDVMNFSSCIGDDYLLLECLEEEGTRGKAYTKVDVRTSCKVMIEFWLNDEGGWIVSRYDVSHNHGFRRVTKNNTGYLQEFKDSKVSIDAGLRGFDKAGWRFASIGNKHLIGVVFVSEWKSNANMKDFCCKEGYVKMIVTESKVQKHANEVYTIGVYKLFEEYLGGTSIGDVEKVSKKDIAGCSAWRRYMFKKLSNLISASELNLHARECVEKGFRMMKDKIASKVGPYYIDNSNNEIGSSIIKDPVRRRAKGERNIKKKSFVDIMCSQARAVLRFTMFTAMSTMSFVSKSNFGPLKNLSSWLLVVWLGNEVGACCALCISCFVCKIRSIPEHSFLNMHVMSMLSAFNSSHASKRWTTLFSNTVPFGRGNDGRKRKRTKTTKIELSFENVRNFNCGFYFNPKLSFSFLVIEILC
ncbi:hypothetical protein M9H77_21107 [Catharanthus roseus]|uniref:Uncharacterized protein n=1 Tax=Catharanthus roseus TaxID=4058 RepID=A0ACC0ANP3_CATRO|nr:hypothetical protein M9H77_21107 [Catharanthus roseus]